MSNPAPERLPSDVRMRGFLKRSTVEAAIQWIDSILPGRNHLPVEDVSLLDAGGRVLARDVTSRISVPGFVRSMMDGYALHADDTQGATAYNPLSIKVVGASLPGAPFSGDVLPGQAVRIMTGAPMPAGADAVLPVENTQLDGQNVLATGETSPGKHVGAIGEDVQSGDVVLSAGRILRPQDLGVLSSIGVAQVPVVRRPRVRIVITGNELAPMGSVPTGHQIADANGPMLAALVARDGGEVVFPGIIPDTREKIRQALLDDADIILVSGGSSVGEEDFAPTLLAELGELPIHGIAMRPSSPTGMGRIAGRPVFLLPGNPVSCLCAYDFFAGRAIRAWAGRSREWPYVRATASLTRKLVSTVGRLDYARVRLQGDEAEPLAISGASILSSTTRADGFVVVPADSEGYPQGARVEVWNY
ncbi:MAG TPA: gephyrin-like molybdotransferase Glp [Caulifigura sp.]|nr:gephyrin-like molybdotransferase Glp [Caulifigura sp.]